MTVKTTTWPTLAVADLAASHALPDVDTALAEDIAANGIQEPLYVTTETGTPRVIDGMRRLAAAVALGLDTVPVTHRPVIHVTTLTAHPGNVRRNLDLSPAFLQSVKVAGIRTAIQITREPGGELRVVDGHRRLAAAIKAGITHVPYLYEDLGEAEQVLDMVTTAKHRAGLTRAEQMTALFDAAELGASPQHMAAAAAVTVKEARQIKDLAKVRAARTVSTTSADLTLEDYALLAQLERLDPAAAEATAAKIAQSPSGTHTWSLHREIRRVEDRAKLAKHLAELTASGAAIRTAEELRDTATRVSDLPGITEAEHHTCQGHVWVADEDAYLPYCTNPALYGHQKPADTTAPKPTASERRAIIDGGRDWDAAEETRREWLARFIGKSRRPKAQTDLMTLFTARVLMSGSEIVSRHALHPKATSRLEQWCGIKEHSGGKLRAAAVTPAKAATQAFAAIATAYEQHAARTVWRTDGSHGASAVRTTTAQYLGWLTDLGYQPTPIEQAVIDDQPYNPAAIALAADQANGHTLD